MKTVKLNISGGRNDSMAQFFNCGKEGDELYAKAQELMEENDSSAIDDFINKNFDFLEPDVELFVHGLDDEGYINVWVEDEDGETVLFDEKWRGTTQRGFILSDPRKWEFDESMGDYLTATIKKFIEESNSKIESAFESLGDGEIDEEFGEDYLCDFADGLSEIIVQAPFVEAGFPMDNWFMKTDKKCPPALFATRCAELYAKGAMSCEIELADDEEFDINKLKLILHDYDGFYCYCKDSALPVAVYGNKFYRLERESWESHYDSYGFAQKDEGCGCFSFSMSSFL